MIRIYVICEGQTEQEFVTSVLYADFLTKNIELRPSLIGGSGGGVSVSRILKDLKSRLPDQDAFCTTFVDFYGLPSDFPGRSETPGQTPLSAKAEIVETALAALAAERFGEAAKRFIPYVQMYEFEGLLFSDPEAFAQAISRPKLSADLIRIRKSFATPEDINDSAQTSPSKRLEKLFEQQSEKYRKINQGRSAALEIGLPRIRAECPRFDAWLKRLEALAA